MQVHEPQPAGVSRRRLLRTVASAPAALMSAAACRPGGAPAAPPPPAGPVALRFVPAGWHLEEDTRIVEQFQQEHPRITVTLEPIPSDYVDKITALQVAGQLPDVIYTADIYVKPFAANKIAANMEALAARDKGSQVLLKDVYPIMLDLGRTRLVPGLYMLPWALDVLVLYYNKTLFQAAGVEFPKPSWTIEDLVSAARRLTRFTGDPATSQYGITLSWTWWAEYVPWMRGYGGDMVSADGRRCTIDEPGAIEGIEAMTGLVTRHQVAPPPGTNFGGNPWYLGKVAMMSTIRVGAAQTRKAVGESFEWDAELRPAFPRKRVTGMGTSGYCVTTQTKHPDEAWRLASYFISPPAQRIFAQSYAAVPVLQSMRNDPAWRTLPPPPANGDAFVKAADYGTLPPEFPLACGSVYTGDVQRIMNQAINDVLAGKTAAAPALRAAAAQINACMTANPETR